MDNKELEYFAKYIYDHTGIMYTDVNFYQLERRLLSLCQRFDVANITELKNMYQLKPTPEMKTLLLDLATNNETSFFRDLNPFLVFASDILPEVIEKNANTKHIKIWSAGCSMGQEPYSLLMTLDEKFPELSSWHVQLDATDISTVALNKTQSGEYTQLEVQRGLPIKKLMSYFDQKDNGNYQVKEFLRKKLQVNPFNLFTDAPKVEHYDIVFCRNVLIYQNVENKERILKNLTRSLKPGGCLFLGNGESLLGIQCDLNAERHDKVSVFRKPLSELEEAA